MKHRILPDGSLYAKDISEELRREYNRKYIPINEFRWRIPVMPKQDLTPLFKDQVTSIVGKGPSLDTTNFHYLPGPLIAINEAFNVLKARGYKPIGIQQDKSLGKCFTALEPDDIIFVSNKVDQAYPDHSDSKKIVYTALDLRVGNPPLSVLCAMKLAYHYGSREFHLYCFDAWCDQTKLAYAQCIGHEPKGDTRRFLKHINYMTRCFKPYPDVKVRLLRPDGEAVDILPQL